MNSNRKLRIALAIAAAMAAAAVAGFLLGRQRPAFTPLAQTVADNRVAPALATRRVLYYRHPMGLNDTSPVPKKDSMGMDYTPVYADQEPLSAGSVTLSPEKIQMIGVRTEPAARRALAQQIVASGTVALTEFGLRMVAPRFDGWIEQLGVSTTGAAVHTGQTLAIVYSPELQATQQEFLVASASPATRELAEAALQRLRVAGVPASTISRLQQTHEIVRSVALLAPISGIVLEKPAVAGMKFTAGETLFKLADTSTVWVIAQVAEQDLPRVLAGQSASFETAAHPGELFIGRVSFIAPTVDVTTRTVQARVELPNGRGRLKPGMFGQVTLTSAAQDALRLSVPTSAVIDSGQRQIVLLSRPGGRFEPREVRLGKRGGQFVEILDGLHEGDLIVSAANFLIDSESNLRGALAGMNPPGTTSQDAIPPTPDSH